MWLLMPSVRREVTLPVDPERAWELITDPEELEGWLADEVELDPEEGGEVRVRFEDGEQRWGTVEEVEPERRLVFSWGDSRVEWTLSPAVGGLPVSRQAVAKHLAALERAGLVTPRREGRETRYRLTPEPLGDAIAWMEDVGGRWDRSLERLSERARRA